MDIYNDEDVKSGFDETTYLLENPVNAERLRMSIAQAEAGETISINLDSLRVLT